MTPRRKPEAANGPAFAGGFRGTFRLSLVSFESPSATIRRSRLGCARAKPKKHAGASQLVPHGGGDRLKVLPPLGSLECDPCWAGADRCHKKAQSHCIAYCICICLAFRRSYLPMARHAHGIALPARSTVSSMIAISSKAPSTK